MVSQNCKSEDPGCAEMKTDCALVICLALEIARRLGMQTDDMEEEAAWLDSINTPFPLFDCVPKQ